MMDLYLIFQFFNGRCYGNEIILRKCYQCRLIPLAFVALVLENESQYHGLAVCINSGVDGATSSKNLVNFLGKILHLFECLHNEEFPVICAPFEGRFHSIDVIARCGHFL